MLKNMENLSYIRGTPRGMPLYKTIPDQLKMRAAQEPDKEVFVFYSRSGQRNCVTFSQMYKKSQTFARALKSLGLKKGDKMLVHLYNTVEWLEVVFGMMAVGVIPVATFIARSDAADLEYVIQRTDATGIVFTERDNSVISGIKQLAVKNLKFKHVVSIDIEKNVDFLISYKQIMSYFDNNTPSLEDVPFDENYLDPDDIAVIMRSSGSTGRPKLISLSHLNLNRSFEIDFSSTFQIQEPKVFSCAEFAWISGSPFFVIISGWAGVTISGDQASVRAEDILKYTEKESCNLVMYTNNILNIIIQNNLHIPSCVHIVVLGGSPIKKSVEILLSTVQCLWCTYGTLEAGRISDYIVLKGMNLEEYIGGYPAAGNEIKIVGDNNQTVSRGIKGKILVRTSNRCQGYYGDEELTRKEFLPSLWYNTCDYGYISDGGMLYVLGRDGESITTDFRTEHVSEIEGVLENINIPHISRILVVPIPNDITHEVICACVTMQQGQSLSECEFMKYINSRINDDYYKPKYVVFMDSFPVNVNGKTDRKLLNKLMIDRLVSNRK